jgi:hypothetical protein
VIDRFGGMKWSSVAYVYHLNLYRKFTIGDPRVEEEDENWGRKAFVRAMADSSKR